MPRGREWALVVVAIAAAAVCVRLGIWQLSRLGTRRAYNAEIRAARARPPLEISGAVPVESIADRRVRVRGVFDYEHERLWRGPMYQGIPGVHVLTPLLLAPDTAVLVDRGWVASADAARIELKEWRGPDSSVVEGIGVRLPRRRGDVDPAILDDSVAYTLLPFGVQEVPQSRGRGTPSTGGRTGKRGEGGEDRGSGGARQPIAEPPAELSNGPHLGYAIQWFSFALIVLIGTFALLRGSRRRQLPS